MAGAERNETASLQLTRAHEKTEAKGSNLRHSNAGRKLTGVIALECRAFLFAIYQLQASANIIGDTYEEWKEETRLDIRAGPRTKVPCAQENTGGKNSQEAKTI
jgi:hypothetical protein